MVIKVDKKSEDMKEHLRKLFNFDRRGLTVFEKAWLVAPLAIWFSYRPLLRFGQDSTMYFELSVAVLYVVMLALAGLPEVWKSKKRLINNRASVAAITFVLISGISLLWTPNIIRGLLTLGLIGALALVFLAAVAAAERLRLLVPVLCKLLVISAVIMSILSILQLIAGIWLAPDTALLCGGCAPLQFGFARPNVFTIEPQFFGNMLIAPALFLFHSFFRKKPGIYVTASTFIIVTALFLTLSRGAIFAFGIGFVLLLMFEARSLGKLGRSTALLIVSFGCCLSLQGAAAAMNPKIETTFAGAVSASVNQLSIGIIDVPLENDKKTNSDMTDGKPVSKQPKRGQERKPNFDGYVGQSTDVRLKLSRLSLTLWREDYRNIVAGVGLGGSGVALRERFPAEVNNREIVQNEYVEILLENGLLGITLFTILIGLLIYGLRHQKWTWSIVLAFLVQWNFFSGYPNALHVYLSLVILAIFCMNKSAGTNTRTAHS